MADDKLYSLQDVLGMFSNVLGKNPTELVALTKEKDLSTLDSLSSELKAIAILDRTALKDAEFSKGFKKSKTNTEKLIKELFPSLPSEDLAGKELDDILVLVRDKTANTDKTKTAITAEQAFQVAEVQSKIKELKDKADKFDLKTKEFESYKSNQVIVQKALSILEKQGAVFSSNPTTKAIQQKAFEAALLEHKYKIDGDKITVLDSEGVNPKWNAAEAKEYDIESFVKTISPVDFGTTTTKPNTTTYTPDASNQGVLNHGYSEAQLKTANLYEERKAALSAGLTAKADFLEKELEKRVMAEEAESKKI